MKKIIVLVMFLTVAGAVFGQDFTFRGFLWGSSVEDVIAVEGEPDYVSDSLLNFNKIDPKSDTYSISYKDRWVTNYKVGLSFKFSTKTDKLIEAGYSFNINYSRRHEIFEDLLNKLTLQYGEHLSKLQIDPVFNELGTWQHTWLSGRTMISLSLHEDEDSTYANCLIRYFSPGIGPNVYGDL